MSAGKRNASVRRLIVAGIATGAMAVPATAAPGRRTKPTPPEQSPVETSMADPNSLDPSLKYPKPPFRRQSQPWPGLAGKMDPKPDHGETSYRGSGRLAGRKALITGGDSGMGRAAAIAYAREGADVAINYFPTEEPDAQEVIALIKAEKRIGLALPGDLRDAAFCPRPGGQGDGGLGGLDIIVNNAGRQQSQASMLDITDEAFDAMR